MTLMPRMRVHEFAALQALMMSPHTPTIVVNCEKCILQGISREDGSGHNFLVKVCRPNLTYVSMFVRVEG